MVFYLGITVLHYNSQNEEVQTGPKQPGPTVCTKLLSYDLQESIPTGFSARKDEIWQVIGILVE